jgi:Spy/CpxP family protein refolding chaperone
MCGGAMRGGVMPGPAMMLIHRESLGLTPEQVQRLEVLAATQRREMERLMPEAMKAMADLMAAASGEIDVKAARAAHDRMARIHSEMLVANLQAMKDARETLTPGQRTRWDAMLSQMGGMKGMMGSMMGSTATESM